MTDLEQHKKKDEYEIKETITHTGYIPLTNSHNGYNDIALVKISRDFEIGKNLKPIRMSNKDIPDRAAMIVSGWGRTSCTHMRTCIPKGNLANKLQYLQVRYLNNAKCYSIFHNGEKYAMDSTYLCSVPRKGTGVYQVIIFSIFLFYFIILVSFFF